MFITCLSIFNNKNCFNFKISYGNLVIYMYSYCMYTNMDLNIFMYVYFKKRNIGMYI